MTTGDFIGLSGALAAISLAVFAFVVPRAVDMYLKRWKSMLSIDMPYGVRNSRVFRSAVFLDSFWMYVVAVSSLFLAIYFISVLANTAAYSLGRPPVFVFTSSLADAFLQGVDFLWWLLWATLIAFVASFFASHLDRGLPIIVRAFAHIVLSTGLPISLPQDLLDKAQSLIDQKQCDEAILHAATSLEYELRRILNLDTTHSFPATLSRLDKIQLRDATPEQIHDVVVMRNQIARKRDRLDIYDEQAAAAVVSSAVSILHQLRELGTSHVYSWLIPA
jgi:hypothetical protein